MRTVRVRYVRVLDATDTIEVETEVLIENDDKAVEAGREALLVIEAVRKGITEAASEGEE